MNIEQHKNLSIDERIEYYMSSFYDKRLRIGSEETLPFDKLEENKIVFCREGHIFDNFRPSFLKQWWNGEWNGEFKITISCFALAAGDTAHYYWLNDHNCQLPVFAWTRLIGCNFILASFGRVLVWRDGYNPWNFSDKPWKFKKPMCVWRGMPSGLWRRNKNDLRCFRPYSNEPDRLQLVEKHIDSEVCDIGFDAGHAGHPSLKRLKVADRLTKPRMGILEQSEYKYIVCIEGNDIPTSLPWSLSSGSLVLMHRPLFENYLMHGTLKPWVHYVPLTNELDIEEKLDWCESNTDACEAIIRNAQLFMNQFNDREREITIHRELVNRYQQQFQFNKG